MTDRTNRLAYDPGGLLTGRSLAGAATPLELRDFRDETGPRRTPVERHAEDASPENWRRGLILPYEKNTSTGETKWAVPGLLEGVFDSGIRAVTLPGRAMRGEVQLTDANGNVSPDAIAESLNFSGWTLPTFSASRVGASVPKGTASDRMPVQQFGNTSQTARRGLSEWTPQEDFSMHAGVSPTVRSAAEAKSLVLFDEDFAQRQSDYVVRRLLGTPTTPNGRQITIHAADRMVNPPPGRAIMSPDEVDSVLDGATRIVGRADHPLGSTLKVENRNMLGRPQVVVDEKTGKRAVTVINPKRR
ncbi:hypothetical protein ACQKGL_14400 [Ensifer adhaerens]|uniref:hypothetical protein n=1 Tax=Ensifer adhaerens TaxID=106592 RepID=UPI003D01452F